VRDFYRTEMGKTLRVEETEEGMLTVAVLKEGSWAVAPLGMIHGPQGVEAHAAANRALKRITQRSVHRSFALISSSSPGPRRSHQTGASDIGVLSGTPSSTTSTTNRTMTATFSTSMTVPPAR
jgi:hypothetical protein